MIAFINQYIRPFVLLFTLSFFLACSKNNDPINESPQKTTIQGAVEKGPFVRGAVVTVYELNTELNPTGRSFKTEIVDDKGSFSLADSSNRNDAEHQYGAKSGVLIMKTKRPFFLSKNGFFVL